MGGRRSRGKSDDTTSDATDSAATGISSLEPLSRELEGTLRFLALKAPIKLALKQKLNKPQEYPACASPDVRTPPQFVITYRQSLLLPPWPAVRPPEQPPPAGGAMWRPIFQFACVQTDLEAHLGMTLRFEQTWNLQRVGIGDLSSTMSLAPSEQLTLEFLSSQRRVLEKTTVDSAEELNSTESTTLDKEVVNVARASSKTENWRVDGSGSFSLGFFSLGASGGYSKTISNSSQYSMQHITEATRKSAHSLKTLHKIEVRGVTETLVQNRMTRLIKNPYFDRTLSLNVFQLIKHFSVETMLAEIRMALVIRITGMTFDKGFVTGNTDFLRETLLDPLLVDELVIALEGARPFSPVVTLQEATNRARLALRYLFDEPNIFNFEISNVLGTIIDPNNPASSFNARPVLAAPVRLDISGFEDARANNLSVIFTAVNVFYSAYKGMDEVTLERNAITLATALAGYVGAKWDAFVMDMQSADAIKNIMDQANLTEVFRRLSGFLAMVAGMVQPLVTAAEEERKMLKDREKNIQALDRLIKHLECNESYYIQRYLVHMARKTDNQAIVDLVSSVISSRVGSQFARVALDPERAFIDRQQIVVPGLFELTDDEIAEIGKQLKLPDDDRFDRESLTPPVIEVEVPCDGIHLEVAQGSCILTDLPENRGKSVELSIEGAGLKVDTRP